MCTKQEKAVAKYIAIDDLISNLGLLAEDVRDWLEQYEIELREDHRGRISVPLEFLERFSSRPEYMGALRSAVLADESARADDFQNTPRLKRERTELLEQYDVYISDLETLHRKYLDSVNRAGYESSAIAAYLLFSRVISTLKMASLCLRNGYWNSGSLLREIDECLDLAQFFVITKGTSKGEKALHQWFRQNRAPKHEDCRKEIAFRMASLFDDDEARHRELLNELYQRKSKFTHPTFKSIREVTKFNVLGAISIEEIDYGPCGYERKLHELTHFFRSSIWSSFQTFLLCFIHEFPLLQEDIEYLRNYDKKFQRWDSVTW